MKKKTKILIIILVIVILVGSWWILNLQKQLPMNLDLKACFTDSDCIIVSTIKGLEHIPTETEGCGCQCVTSINKNFVDLWEQKQSEFKDYECKTMCKPCGLNRTNSEAKCENNQCVAKPSQKVNIITDKTEYGQGETVKIIIENNAKSEEEICTPSLIYTIERYNQGKWDAIRMVSCPCDALCDLAINLTLEPGERLSYEWDQAETWCSDPIKDFSETISEQVPAGRYRVRIDVSEGCNPIYSNEFAIKEKDETADWQIYKNEEYGFEIKYPQDFNIQENDDAVTFCGGEATQFCGIQGASYHPEIYLFKLKKDGSRKDLYSFAFGDDELPKSDYWPFGKHPDTINCQVVSIKVADNSGKLWDCDYGTGYGQLVAFWQGQEDNFFYLMDVSLYDKFPTLRNTFDQILSTFRFLE